MKFLSAILATYILVLIATPSLAMVHTSNKMEHCKKSCCHSTMSSKKQSKPLSKQNKGCCNNGICNPFMSCCNSCTLTAKLQVLSSISFTNQKFNSLTENLNSVFLSDTWHPPKAV